MRIIYVCPFAGRCGGTKVIAEHVSRLALRGHAAEWWGLDPAPAWFGKPVPYRRFQGTDQLGAALRNERGVVKIATWWQTASWIVDNLMPGDNGFYHVQDIDQETYSHDTSGSSYKLGLKPITESAWVTRQLQQRWNLDPTNVGIGIDLELFRPLPGHPRDLNRIFTTYRPGAGPNDLKGWRTALLVAQLVHRENPQTGLVTFGSHGPPPGIPPGLPHIHIGSPSDTKLVELYNEAGVYLMTSKHEGFCLPAAEAMACRTPVVTTNANGNMEFCRHGDTALVGRSAEELAHYVLCLQRYTPMRDKHTAAAFDLMHADYRWDAVIDRLERLLCGG